MTRAQFIVNVASEYRGYKKKNGNIGFESDCFEKEMKSVGWYKGAPWCAFFVKLLFVKAYECDKEILNKVYKLSHGSSLVTFNNYKNDSMFTVGTEPRPGAQVVWRIGNGLAGHTGIVASVYGNTMECWEGNTNAPGSREGNTVARKLRTVKRDFKVNGLNVVGYIYPLEN